jgi:hypothetical protein
MGGNNGGKARASVTQFGCMRRGISIDMLCQFGRTKICRITVSETVVQLQLLMSSSSPVLRK